MSNPCRNAIFLFFFVGLVVFRTGVVVHAKSLKALQGSGTRETPAAANPQPPAQESDPVLALFDFLNAQTASAENLAVAESGWEMGFVPMVLDSLRFFPPDDARAKRLWDLLERMTGERLRRDFNTWLQWMWQQEYKIHSDYPGFKAALHAHIDPRFRWWFYPGMTHTIRLDEILWGGG